MEKEFIPYEQALALKELGYNEQDFGYYRLSLKEEQEPFTDVEIIFFRERYDNHNFRLERHPQIRIGGGICSAPLYQQAFRWLLILVNKNKHFFNEWTISYNQDYYSLFLGGCNMGVFKTELECLKKLIEIVKEK